MWVPVSVPVGEGGRGPGPSGCAPGPALRKEALGPSPALSFWVSSSLGLTQALHRHICGQAQGAPGSPLPSPSLRKPGSQGCGRRLQEGRQRPKPQAGRRVTPPDSREQASTGPRQRSRMRRAQNRTEQKQSFTSPPTHLPPLLSRAPRKN